MNKWLFFLFMYICPLATQEAMAEEHGDTLQQKEIDANSPVIADSVTDSNIVEKPKRDFFHKVGDVFTKFFKEFNNVDTNYIEPQRYNYTVMLQNTNTYEQYRLSGKNGESVTFGDMTGPGEEAPEETSHRDVQATGPDSELFSPEEIPVVEPPIYASTA